MSCARTVAIHGKWRFGVNVKVMRVLEEAYETKTLFCAGIFCI